MNHDAQPEIPTSPSEGRRPDGEAALATAGSGSGKPVPALAVAPLLALAGLFVLLELGSALNGAYGYFIDEFYYLSCAARPALGYVDHPPLAVWVLALVRPVIGDSVFALRLLPALAGGLTVLIAGSIARRLGAEARGQILAGLAVALCPGMLSMHGFYSMNGFEVPIWAASTAVLVRIAATNDRRWWLVFGLLAGIGLLNKHTFVTLGGTVFLGLMLSRARRDLATAWPWLGAGLSALMVAPNLLWQLDNGWPSLEFYRNAALHKNVATEPLAVVAGQILVANPGALPVWGAGLAALLLSRRFRPYRHLGWVYVGLLALMIASQQARPDRMLGMYPLMFAAGAAWWGRQGRAWLVHGLAILTAVVGLAIALAVLPVLPPAQLASYAAALGVTRQVEAGPGKTSPLPQLLADRFAWQEFVDEIVQVVDSLDADERGRAAILAPSYGHAGALELLGPADLPPVISGHNTWHLWGLPEGPIDVLVSTGYRAETLRLMFREVEQVGATSCTYCMAWRNGLPIAVSRGIEVPLHERWSELKLYQ